MNVFGSPEENGLKLADDGHDSGLGVEAVGLSLPSSLRERRCICSLEGYSQTIFRPTQLAHG